MTLYGIGQPVPHFIIMGTAKNVKTQADFKAAQYFVATGKRLPVYELDGPDCQAASNPSSQWFVATLEGADLAPSDVARRVWEDMSVWVEAHSRLI